MAERPDFQETQFGFAAHLRDPAANPAPDDIEDRRMAIYRELFFNNVAGLLGRTFPVLHKILGAERWAIVMRDYFSRHQSHTPLFLEMLLERFALVFVAVYEEELADLTATAIGPPHQLVAVGVGGEGV